MTSTEVTVTSPQLPATSSPQHMAVRLQDMRQQVDLVHDFFVSVMKPCTYDEKGVSRVDGDYGIIPGTDKPTLLKPGAEKLCGLYGYAVTFPADRQREVIDYETGFLRVVSTAVLVDKHTGEIAGHGIGECNTKEARYARRWVFDRDIPEGLDPSTLKQRTGTARGSGRPYTMYLIENDDPFTLWNTVTKMSAKRALVAATLTATCASQLFTQGGEALKDWVEGEYTYMDDDEADAPKTPPKPVETARPNQQRANAPKTSQGAAQTPRQENAPTRTETPAPAPAPAAAPTGGGFYSQVEALGYTREDAEKASLNKFNESPAKLTTDQRRELFAELKAAKEPTEQAPAPASDLEM